MLTEGTGCCGDEDFGRGFVRVPQLAIIWSDGRWLGPDHLGVLTGEKGLRQRLRRGFWRVLGSTVRKKK